MWGFFVSSTEVAGAFIYLTCRKYQGLYLKGAFIKDFNL